MANDRLTQFDLMEIATHMMKYTERFIVHNNTITSKDLCKLFVRDGKLDYELRSHQNKIEVKLLCFTYGGMQGLMRSKCNSEQQYQELYVILLDEYIFDPFNRMLGICIRSWVKSHDDMLFLESEYSDKISTYVAKQFVENYVTVSGRSLETLDDLADYNLRADIVTIQSDTYKIGDYAKEFFIHPICNKSFHEMTYYLRDYVGKNGGEQ